MAGDLYVNIKPEQPVTIKEDPGHQDTMRFEKGQGIPENVGIGGIKLVLQKGTHSIINGIPEAQQQICPLPNLWYVIKNFQALKIWCKVKQSKGKAFKQDRVSINIQLCLISYIGFEKKL